MPIHIDQFSVFGGVVVVNGWSSDYTPGSRPTIVFQGKPLETVTVPVSRPDVAAVFGAGSEMWGFRICAASDLPQLTAADIGIRISAEVMIESVSTLNPPQHDQSHALFSEFVNEVNALGGTILEIGSRARSGNTSRERFGPNVKYVGADVLEGENVDIVVDAHHLSDIISQKFDYVFSISTFEHFLMPWKVALEINKILRVGGKVFSHSHQSWPCHDEPWDFFRFSREAWSGLFNQHTGFRVCDARRGDAVSIVNQYTPGGSFDGLEKWPGYGMSVCVAEKIAPALVSWDAAVSMIQPIDYKH